MLQTRRRLKEKAVKLTAENVLKVLAGHKTQIVRSLDPQPRYRQNNTTPGHYGTFYRGWNLDHEKIRNSDLVLSLCNYGQKHQILWVQEPFNQFKNEVSYQADFFAFSLAIGNSSAAIKTEPDQLSWLPSARMSRGQSRIDLLITSVRLQRIQSLTKQDAIANGFESREAFAKDWDQEQKRKRRLYWDADPWCWFIDFDRITQR